ncbi:MAG: FAD-dependent oxidoreductase [Prolixibacteraceae bacterium]|nr:FAD-dependent oxidoreductase [Prolixibacteraceae bacterium]MBT6999814.1 FAD-dependent oxidoreductase [Prolixibacteraceae bacterium]MBT7395365.1 FAD-dependent oxidoreductase [Prolixibacteraceae bacterium]
MKAILTTVFCITILIFGCKTSQEPDISFEADVIIYGGTSAAIIAAVEIAQSDKSVIVVSPDKHLGGLTAGGLGWTDTGKKETIGGLSREFYHRIWKHYDSEDSWVWQQKSEYGNRGQGTMAIDGDQRTMWIFEPHAAEQVFEDFITENNIQILRDEWLDREDGVIKKDGKIVSLKTLSGKILKGKVFIDATYEGDLMANSGVSYHVGRESSATYNEKYNGIQTGVLHHQHWFWEDISPYKIPGDPSSGLLPRISAEPPGEYGAGDNKIQAYCFRMCMTNHDENRIPFPKPENYDAGQYELLLRSLETGRKDWFSKFDPIPNKKTDTNNHGPFSSDNIGMNYDYPEASYERRVEIIKEHRDYQKGLLWFVANDPRVPEDIRTKMATWGLAKDEFTDNENWPHQIYVREARRMIGEYVSTENDVLLKRVVPKSVGMGSYAMDSHNIQRYITPEGFVQNEGDIGVSPPAPYSISYGSLIPKKEDCENLLVPVCVSSSHIAFGSIRMEPVFMILGQSAAIAACMAIDEEIAVQDVEYEKLKTNLLEKGQVLTLSEISK